MKTAIGIRRMVGMSGCPALVLEQTRRLTEAGWRCDLYAERLDPSAVGEAGGRPVALRRMPGPGYLSRLSFARRVDAQTRSGRYDVIIGHGDLLNQDCLFIHNPVELERELFASGIEVARDPQVRFHRTMFERRGYRLLIANSELVSEDLQRRYGLSAENIRVVYPGYDPVRFNIEQRAEFRELMREGLGIGDRLLLGFVTSGNFPMRGADILADCIAGLPPDLRAGLRVLAVGRSRNLEMMQRLFAERGLEELLIGRGKIPDVQRYYHALDLLIHPARLEPFGLVIVEAIGCGTPVLTSRRSGAAEILPDDGVVEAPSPAAFAERLAPLLTDSAARRSLLEGQRAAAVGCTLEAWGRNWCRQMEAFGLMRAA